MAVKTKKISSWKIILVTYPNAGGKILLWKKATKDDVSSAERLPHIYTLSTDKKLIIIDTVYFVHNVNAIEEYKDLKKVSDVHSLIFRNN